MSRYNRHRSASERPERPDGKRYQSKRTSSVTKSVQTGPRFTSTRSDEELEAIIKAQFGSRGYRRRQQEEYDRRRKRRAAKEGAAEDVTEIDNSELKPGSNIGEGLSAAKQSISASAKKRQEEQARSAKNQKDVQDWRKAQQRKRRQASQAAYHQEVEEKAQAKQDRKDARVQAYEDWKAQPWQHTSAADVGNYLKEGFTEMGNGAKRFGSGAESFLTEGRSGQVFRNAPAGAELAAAGLSGVSGLLGAMGTAVNTLINPDMFGNSTAQGLLGTTQQSLDTMTDAMGHAVNAVDIAGANNIQDQDKKFQQDLLKEIVYKDYLSLKFSGRSKASLSPDELKEYYKQLEWMAQPKLSDLTPEQLQEYQDELHKYSMQRAKTESRLAGSQAGEALKQGREVRADIVPNEMKRRELEAKANKYSADIAYNDAKAQKEQFEAAQTAYMDESKRVAYEDYMNAHPNIRKNYDTIYGNDAEAKYKAFFNRFPERLISLNSADQATKDKIGGYMEGLSESDIKASGKSRAQIVYDLLTTGKDMDGNVLFSNPPWDSINNGDYDDYSIPELKDHINYLKDNFMLNGRFKDKEREREYTYLLDKKNELERRRDAFDESVPYRRNMNRINGMFRGSMGGTVDYDGTDGVTNTIKEIIDSDKDLTRLWNSGDLSSKEFMTILSKGHHTEQVKKMREAFAKNKASIFAKHNMNMAELFIIAGKGHDSEGNPIGRKGEQFGEYTPQRIAEIMSGKAVDMDHPIEDPNTGAITYNPIFFHDTHGKIIRFTDKEIESFLRTTAAENVFRVMEMAQDMRNDYAENELLREGDFSKLFMNGEEIPGKLANGRYLTKEGSDYIRGKIDQAVQESIDIYDDLINDPDKLMNYTGNFEDRANPTLNRNYRNGVFAPLFNLTEDSGSDHYLPPLVKNGAADVMNPQHKNQVSKFIPDPIKGTIPYLLNSINVNSKWDSDEHRAESLYQISNTLDTINSGGGVNEILADDKTRQEYVAMVKICERNLNAMRVGEGAAKEYNKSTQRAITSAMGSLAQARIRSTIHYKKTPTGGMVPAIYNHNIEEFFTDPSNQTKSKQELLGFMSSMYMKNVHTGALSAKEKKRMDEFENMVRDYINDNSLVSTPLDPHKTLEGDSALTAQALAMGIWGVLLSEDNMNAATTSMRRVNFRGSNYLSSNIEERTLATLGQSDIIGSDVKGALKDPRHRADIMKPIFRKMYILSHPPTNP